MVQYIQLYKLKFDLSLSDSTPYDFYRDIKVENSYAMFFSNIYLLLIEFNNHTNKMCSVYYHANVCV